MEAENTQNPLLNPQAHIEIISSNFIHRKQRTLLNTYLNTVYSWAWGPTTQSHNLSAAAFGFSPGMTGVSYYAPACVQRTKQLMNWHEIGMCTAWMSIGLSWIGPRASTSARKVLWCFDFFGDRFPPHSTVFLKGTSFRVLVGYVFGGFESLYFGTPTKRKCMAAQTHKIGVENQSKWSRLSSFSSGAEVLEI